MRRVPGRDEALIQRPVEEVLAFISDTRNNSQWQCGPGHITLLPTEGDEEKERWGVISRRGPFELDSVYHLEPIGEDTKITWTCKVKAREQYRFAGAVMSQVTTMETDVSFMILKKLLEAEPTI
jgi:hypothetical protein